MQQKKKHSSIQRSFISYSIKNFWAEILIASSFALSLWWINYTGYIEEDAFITFRFAKQIAHGNGFVYNIGEQVYGTTTPLFTLLLAGWVKYISTDIIFGARALGSFASAGTLFFTWKTLTFLKRSTAEQFFPLIFILFSSQMLSKNTQGMEMPLVLFLMSASWYTNAKGKIKWTAFLSGLLLWTRIDLALWVLLLVVISTIHNRKNAMQIAFGAGLIYLPWVIFATFYFGSPIPHTVTAKWVAYNQFSQSPFLPHLKTILNYLSPFYKMGDIFLWGPLIIFSLIAWAIWRGIILREKNFLFLFLFIILEIALLTLTRATFFKRYFIPILWATLLLFGIALGMLWDRLKEKQIPKYIFNAFLILIMLTTIISGLSYAASIKMKQEYRFENSLKEIGVWLNENSDPQSTVLLEPLGYIGYYSERKMIDEVGLVTPEVTNLKLQGISSEQYLSVFQPDYAILHCDDALRLHDNEKTELARKYTLAKESNPLSFDPSVPNQSSDFWGLARLSCYQIWQKVNN